MTEQGKPLSRRERRAMEARAAGNAPEPTESIVRADEHPPPTDGLSRRDRRRIERARQPMESWTAEEEMIATGQLPAMTPQRIAEQERIAKEKAAEAAADAAAAAAALGFVPDADEPEADGADATPPVRESAFARMAEHEAVDEDPVDGDQADEDQVDADNQVAEGQDQAQTRSEFAHAEEATDAGAPASDAAPVDDETPATADDAPATDAGTPASDAAPVDDAPVADDNTLASDSAPIVDDGDSANDDADAADPAESHTPAVAASEFLEPELSDPDDDGIPAAFRGMFPPGSLQAQARAARKQERRAEQADAEDGAATASADTGGTSGAAAEVTPRIADDRAQADSIEEIRRLTAQAMAGLERSSHHDTDEASPAAPGEPHDTQQHDAAHSDTSDTTDAWSTPHEAPHDDSAELDVTPVPAANPVAVEDIAADNLPDTDVADADVAGDDVVTEQTPWQASSATQSPAAPHHASFDDVIATRSGEVPLAEQQVDPDAPVPTASAEHPTVAPSIWDSHPLNATDARGRELADAPSQAIPRPDFSTLAPAKNPGHPAPFSPEAYSSGEPPLTTGSIEVAPRKVPELHPAGGARHFRWAHIAVIGAVAFVLGVLVWNLAGQTS